MLGVAISLHQDSSIWQEYFSGSFHKYNRNGSLPAFNYQNTFIYRVEFYDITENTPVYYSTTESYNLLISNVKFYNCDSSTTEAGTLYFNTYGSCVQRQICSMYCTCNNLTYGAQTQFVTVTGSNLNYIESCTFIGNHGSGEASSTLRAASGSIILHASNFSQNNCLQQVCYVLKQASNNVPITYNTFDSNTGYNLRQLVHASINANMNLCSVTNNSLEGTYDSLFIAQGTSEIQVFKTVFKNNSPYYTFMTMENGWIYIHDISIDNSGSTILFNGSGGGIYTSSSGTISFSMYVAIEPVCIKIIPEERITCPIRRFDIRAMVLTTISFKM